MTPLVTQLPLRAGMRVGLLGGSFDPPHRGHRHISRAALRRFGLTHVIWLVSPGNPLKPNPPAPLPERIFAAETLLTHPRIVASDFEARIGTRFTAETLAAALNAHPGVRFVWLMGADNLAQFHLWENWTGIARSMPLGVLARPGQRMPALTAPAARILRRHRLREAASHLLPDMRPPCWCFVNVPMIRLSSTNLRAERQNEMRRRGMSA